MAPQHAWHAKGMICACLQSTSSSSQQFFQPSPVAHISEMTCRRRFTMIWVTALHVLAVASQRKIDQVAKHANLGSRQQKMAFHVSYGWQSSLSISLMVMHSSCIHKHASVHAVAYHTPHMLKHCSTNLHHSARCSLCCR